MTDIESPAYAQGWYAAKDELPTSANPYAPGSRDRADWLTGHVGHRLGQPTPWHPRQPHQRPRRVVFDATPDYEQPPVQDLGDAVIVETPPSISFLAGFPPTPQAPRPRSEWEPPVKKDRERGGIPVSKKKVIGPMIRVIDATAATLPKFKVDDLPETAIKARVTEHKPVQTQNVSRETMSREAMLAYHRERYRAKNPNARPYKPRARRRTPEEMQADRAAKAAAALAKAAAPKLTRAPDYHKQHQLDVYMQAVVYDTAAALGMDVDVEAAQTVRDGLDFLKKTTFTTAPPARVLAFFTALGRVFKPM